MNNVFLSKNIKLSTWSGPSWGLKHVVQINFKTSYCLVIGGCDCKNLTYNTLLGTTTATNGEFQKHLGLSGPPTDWFNCCFHCCPTFFRMPKMQRFFFVVSKVSISYLHSLLVIEICLDTVSYVIDNLYFEKFIIVLMET